MPMQGLPGWNGIPPGYVGEESGRGRWVVRERDADVLRDAGFGPDGDARLAPSQLAGRRPLFELEGAGGAFLVRRFSHGGLGRWLTGERFLDAARPFRELELSLALRELGIPTPEVVAARARRAGLVGWRLEVVTRRVPRALDLGYVLGLAREGAVEPRALARIVTALGRLVRRLHDAGFQHADLQPNNVLVAGSALEGGEPELWLIDLDRSRLRGRLSTRERRDNLRRLFRHVRRRELERGRVLERTAYARFLRGYEESREARKADWRAIARRHALVSGLHRLGWVLERAFGRSADPRDRGSG